MATLFLAVGYTSYAKTALTVPLLGIFTLLWFAQGAPWHRFWYAVRRFWPAWITYTALTVVWTAFYVTGESNARSGDSVAFPSLAQAEVFLSTVPSMFGGPLKWIGFPINPVVYAATPTWFVALSVTTLALLAIYAWGTRERALGAWIPVGGYLFVSILLIYVGRGTIIGVLGGDFIGRQVQYIGDSAPLLAIGLAGMFVPVVGATHPIRLRDEPIVRISTPKWTIATGVVVAIIGGVWSSAAYAAPWRGDEWEARSSVSAAIVDITQRGNTRFADVGVPATMMTPLAQERAAISGFFAPISAKFTVQQSGVDLSILSDDGRVVPADTVPDENAPSEPDLEACTPVGATGRLFDVPTPPAFGQWLSVDYRSNVPGRITVTGTGTSANGIASPGGIHRLMIYAPAPQSTVRVYATDVAQLCVNRIQWGYVGAGP